MRDGRGRNQKLSRNSSAIGRGTTPQRAEPEGAASAPLERHEAAVGALTFLRTQLEWPDAIARASPDEPWVGERATERDGEVGPRARGSGAFVHEN